MQVSHPPKKLTDCFTPARQFVEFVAYQARHSQATTEAAARPRSSPAPVVLPSSGAFGVKTLRERHKNPVLM